MAKVGQSAQIVDLPIPRRNRKDAVEVGERRFVVTEPAMRSGTFDEEGNGVGIGCDFGVETGQMFVPVSMAPCARHEDRHGYQDDNRL